MEEIVLVGGGGHCRACIDVIEAENKFRIAGVVDVKEKIGTKIMGYDIFATDDDLPRLVKDYKSFFVTIGHMKDPGKRITLYEYLKGIGATFPVIVSPTAYVSDHARVASGAIIMHKASVGINVKIGNNCIINTGAIVEHDSTIDDYCHISTGAVVNGNCIVGSGTFVGSNSVIVNDIKITEGTLIGAGSVVIESIAGSGIYAGNPAKKISNEALAKVIN